MVTTLLTFEMNAPSRFLNHIMSGTKIHERELPASPCTNSLPRPAGFRWQDWSAAMWRAQRGMVYPQIVKPCVKSYLCVSSSRFTHKTSLASGRSIFSNRQSPCRDAISKMTMSQYDNISGRGSLIIAIVFNAVNCGNALVDGLSDFPESRIPKICESLRRQYGEYLIIIHPYRNMPICSILHKCIGSCGSGWNPQIIGISITSCHNIGMAKERRFP